MSQAEASLGEAAEQAVAEFLAARGWRVEARRWRCFEGELDLVACRDELRYGQACQVVIFVEVKARRRGDEGAYAARLSVGAAKRRRLVIAAQRYLAQRRAEQADVACSARFDVACVQPVADEQWAISYLEGAFDGAGQL